MGNLKSRLLQIAEFKGISTRSLEVLCNLNRGNISNIADGGSIGSDKLAKIFDAIREINPIWLICGRGNMLIDEGIQQSDGNTTAFKAILQLLKEKDDEIGRLREEIGGLKEKQKTLEQNARKNDYLIAEPAEFSGAAEP